MTPCLTGNGSTRGTDGGQHSSAVFARKVAVPVLHARPKATDTPTLHLPPHIKLWVTLTATCVPTLLDSDLEVSILLDYSRGQRSGPHGSSVSMLSPLLSNEMVQLSLLRMPQLSGWKKHLPSPIDETVAVNHCKIYAFDDDVIISGKVLLE